MNTQNQIKEVEVQIDAAREAVALADALERLHDNPDFKKVILDDFFVNESSRVVLAKGDYNAQSKEAQDMFDRIIVSIGGLRAYFSKVFQLGEQMRQSLQADEQTREELYKEDLEAVEGVMQ